MSRSMSRTASTTTWCTVSTGAVNPAGKGTKAAALQKLVVAPGESERMRLRLTSASAPAGVSTVDPLGAGFDSVLNARRSEADDFYATVIDPSLDADATNVMRQALAGMLWSKQYYEYDVHTWLREHGVNPWSQSGQEAGLRNTSWFHLDAGDVISMPDKWEYPWFAAWDLALQTLPLALVDVDFAKGQMELLLKDRYLHPNGQIPAYEWNFSDVNPPLHAWSALLLYEREREIRGEGDAVVPRACVRAAVDELHLVGQPQGPRRSQPVPGRLPRPRQHRRVRPLCAPSGRRLARAGRWNGVDGALLSGDAPDGARAEQPRSRVRGHGDQVRDAPRVDRRCHEPTRRRGVVVGGGRVLLRRDPAARWQHEATAGALPGRPAADVRGNRDRREIARARPRSAGEVGCVHQQVPGSDPGARTTCRSGRRRQAPGVARRRRPAAEDPGDHARRVGVPRPVRDPFDLALPRRPPLRLRHRRAAVPRGLRAGRVEHGHVRRELELARTGLVSR